VSLALRWPILAPRVTNQLYFRVRAHLKGMYRKLGLESRAETVGYAIRNQRA